VEIKLSNPICMGNGRRGGRSKSSFGNALGLVART
jgi:hypothetical protein